MFGSRFCRALAAAALVVCAWACAPALTIAEVISLGDEDYASLAGYVYVDLNLNWELEVGEALIPDVVVILEGLTDKGELVSVETSTSQYGAYSFTGVLPGVYSVTEVQPIEFLQGLPNEPGTVNGTPVGEAAGPDAFVNIALDAGDVGIMYNFGEAGLRSAYISKRHFLTYEGEPEDPPGGDIPEPGGATLLSVGSLLLLYAFWRRPSGREIARGRFRGR